MSKTNRQPKPTTILTGFLGAGKTTYLNHMLENNPDVRYAIIENEYGEQSIDSDLIIRAEDDIVELNNGCLCCTLNDNLYDILNTLFERRDEYDEIIIEATGVADPTGLAEPFIAHSAIKKQFPLNSIICIVDAELIYDHLQDTVEAISQITFSDVLLINKTSLISESYLKSLEEELGRLNPLARIVLEENGNFPQIAPGTHNALFDEMHYKKQAHHHDHGHGHHHEHKHHHGHDHKHHHHDTKDHFPVQKPHHHHHHEHTDVVSHTFIIDEPLSHSALYHQFLTYLMFQSKGLYRMKGLINMNNSDQQFIIQSVGKRLNISEKRAWAADEKRQSTIVFIGKNIKREGLEKLLYRCVASPTASSKK
ncbi:MAG: GTP-binding protein [Bacteroidota bacterium]